MHVTIIIDKEIMTAKEREKVGGVEREGKGEEI